MCGICGVLNFDNAPVERSLLDKMSATMRHRGPDGGGIFTDGEVGLAHRRLSIIDVDGGVQPMTNETRSIWIVFNGEIYNFLELRQELLQYGHTFHTRSDTEVIIHAYEQWGLDCLNRFNGIFAFALWDSLRKTLVLARDHLGVKPLYYTHIGQRFLFASEIKALLMDSECPRSVDLQSLSTLFTLRYVPSPDTLFAKIKKLPPAHVMVVHEGCATIRRYWFTPPTIDESTSQSALIERYQALVEDAVRLQMRSDVPVGLFLSSGIDSGTLLAIMRSYSGRPVRTFTIGFDEGETSNETADASDLAHKFGAIHEQLVIGPGDYERYYDRYLWDLEEPVGNETAAAFYFVSMIASRSVKVALTGQGVDEPWAGYHRHLGAHLSTFYSRLPHYITTTYGRFLADTCISNERLRRGMLSLGEPNVLERLIQIYSFFSPGMKRSLFRPWLRNVVSTTGREATLSLAPIQRDVNTLDPLTQILYLDTRSNLPDDLLMVADKTAMANSVEVRVPFLDRRIVEFVETLAPSMKIRRFQGKYLHKKAVHKWLPKQLIYRPKKGFANPIQAWLRGRMSQYVGDCLLSSTAAVNEFFDPTYIKTLVQEHQLQQRDHLRHIYLLISFELWHRQFIRQSPATLCARGRTTMTGSPVLMGV
jgi:asparagine synthase (glutamine-hydrolysing)